MVERPAPVDLARAELYGARPADWLVNFTQALLVLQGDALDVAYFLSRPEKWATELVAWHDAGRPTDDAHPGWAQFADAVEPATS